MGYNAQMAAGANVSRGNVRGKVSGRKCPQFFGEIFLGRGVEFFAGKIFVECLRELSWMGVHNPKTLCVPL